MIRIGVLRFGAGFALAAVLLGPTSDRGTAQARELAASTATEDANRGWEAVVSGTGGDGLRVRQGPGAAFPQLAMLPEGTRVRVLGGPSFDATGTDWYQLSGFSGPSVSGWSSGEFLAQVAPSPASASTVGAATSTGHSFSARITAYTYQTPGNGAHGSITRSGTPVRWGVLAVDPRVIPLGSRVQIEGFNDVFIAEDTGGGVIGNHVEIFYGDYGSAIRFGVQVRTVTVLP